MKNRWAIWALILALTPTRPAAAQDRTADAEPPANLLYWEELRPQLEYHPIGMVLPKGKLRFINLLRMHPAGFQADEIDPFISPTYGLGGGWQATIGSAWAERLGPGGSALFYGAGIQKQLVYEGRSKPAVSVGAYGMFGPGSYQGGTLFLSATKLAVGAPGKRFALFLDAGAKLQTYDSDDYGSSTGIRPYVGATVAVGRRFFIVTEFSPNQPWAPEDMVVVRGTYVVRIKGQTIGVSGGVRNVGYGSHGFVGLTF